MHHYWSALIISQTRLWRSAASHIQHPQGTRSYSSFRQHGEITSLMHCVQKSVWFVKLGSPFSNFSSWLLLLGDKCVGIRSPLPQRAKDFKRRGLRLRPISPDITNEISCLGTCNVSLPPGVLIITHKKAPHQSNWILERKSKCQMLLILLRPSLSASRNTNRGVGECQPSFCEEPREGGRRLQSKKSLKGKRGYMSLPRGARTV